MFKTTGWRLAWTIFVVGGVILFGVIVGWTRLQTETAQPPAEAGPQQVAAVNGVALTQQMVDRELKVSRLNVAQPLPPLQGDDLARAREEALNQLITRQIILQEASRQGFALEQDFIEQRVDLLFGSYGDDALDEALAQADLNRADLLWWAGQIFTVEAFTTQVIMAGARPEQRQAVYNSWLNQQQAQAQITTFEAGQAQTRQILRPGQPAPDFTLSSVDGRQVTLSDYSGQVVLVNFWATWCPSCVTEMPDYEQLYRQHTPDFVVLGVNLQESPDHVQQYATGLGLSFPVLLDDDGTVTSRQYQVTGMPGSFIIDRTGTIFYRHIGPMSGQTLATKLTELGL